MKKISFLLAVIFLLLVVVGCSSEPTLEKTLKKLDDLRSFTLDIKVEYHMDHTPDKTGVFKYSGDVSSFTEDGETRYLTKEKKEMYKVHQVDSKWVKEKIEVDSQDFQDYKDINDLIKLFADMDTNWFEDKEGTYVMKEAFHEKIVAVVDYDVSNVKFTFDKDSATLNFSMTLDSFESYTITMKVVDMNKTKVTLPKVEVAG